ncbi:hypothetical protein [Roseibacillus ishigakijimensis]|uniref:Uncharacterized protein n=1 Tax=Roseibacillus ishigakijimensis TaxID=454146 RepID=A0A934RPY2_9BACT|nr:hypothetical protein [Roseibacillus ishigakijimensis]MBK1833323.1 hypothetical protein [Roseibacillus ishigakijimensis]
MKRICSLLFLLSLQLCLAQGEVPDDVGFVRFMNLIDAGQGKVDLKIDGSTIWKPGYTLGQRTGALPYRGGKRSFLVSREGCLPAEREITVEAGKAQTVVAFAEEEFDENGESLGWQIKLARLAQHTPESGLVVTFISFCKEDVIDLEITEAMSQKTFKQAVNKRRTTRLKLVENGRVRASVKCGGDYIGTIKVDDEGNYVAFIFEGDEGRKKLITFYDPEFMISGS